MDRERLAEFLRARREALQPEDVGLPRGPRRRTGGLRREEVAVLSDMSIDYYNRLEQKRGPRPSEQMLSALARGLRLALEDRDHMFHLAGYAVPHRGLRADHLNPGMQRIVDGLGDAAAQVVNGVGESLRQTPLAVALFGDESAYIGLARSQPYRWFTDPRSRLLYPPEDHEDRSATTVAFLHAAYTRGDGREIVHSLLRESPDFAARWRKHPVPAGYCAPKRLLHPAVGPLELHCQTLLDPDQSQALVVYTATPGTESHDKLDLLRVLGPQPLDTGR